MPKKHFQMFLLGGPSRPFLWVKICGFFPKHHTLPKDSGSESLEIITILNHVLSKKNGLEGPEQR